MLNNLKTKVVNMAGRTGLKVQKHSPEILLGAGVVTMIGTVILASKATLHVEEIIDEHTYNRNRIKEVYEMEPENYPKHKMQQDLFVTYTRTTVDFVKLYAPAITLGLLSVTCFMGAHNIMKRRNIAIMGAYKALDSRFKDFERRVEDKYGEEEARNLKHGITKEKETFEEVDENGKKKKVKKDVEKVKDLSPYAVHFNSQSSSQFSRTPGANMLYIQAQENYANQVLHSRGHVFLNEVHDYLGLPHTPAGAVTGWVRGNADDFISFGAYKLKSQDEIYDSYREDSDIILDFNVDGVIYDLI